MQEIEVKNSAITIQDYYANLTKKEKTQILSYLMMFVMSSLLFVKPSRRK